MWARFYGLWDRFQRWVNYKDFCRHGERHAWVRRCGEVCEGHYVECMYCDYTDIDVDQGTGWRWRDLGRAQRNPKVCRGTAGGEHLAYGKKDPYCLRCGLVL